jgi:hypothetical protein
MASDLVCEWDLFALSEGPVLSAVATFAGDLVRGRLAYLPDEGGPVVIGHRRYRKVVHDVVSGLPGTLSQVMRWPGENHFIVDRMNVARWYPAVAPVAHRLPGGPRAMLAAMQKATRAPVLLGGSRAIGCESAGSDFDWIVRGGPSAVEPVAAAVRALPCAEPALPGSIDFMRSKYAHMTRLHPADLQALALRRWRHVRVAGVQASVDFADPYHLADGWIATRPVRAGRGRVVGTVVDASECYRTPKIITVVGPRLRVQVMTWLNLYTGALVTGDAVGVFGTWLEIGGRQVLLIEESDDIIRVIRQADGGAPGA